MPWQYFAMSDKECETFYGIKATQGVPTFLGDDEVICTSRHSDLNPLENGEVSFACEIVDHKLSASLSVCRSMPECLPARLAVTYISGCLVVCMSVHPSVCSVSLLDGLPAISEMKRP